MNNNNTIVIDDNNNNNNNKTLEGKAKARELTRYATYANSCSRMKSFPLLIHCPLFGVVAAAAAAPSRDVLNSANGTILEFPVFAFAGATEERRRS
jgi:hypothetical protein